MNAQDHYKNLQAAIEFDAAGAPLKIDGIPGPVTIAAFAALNTSATRAPFDAYPAPAAPVDSPIAPSILGPVVTEHPGFVWKACLAPITVGNSPGSPPAAFLDELVSVIKVLPDEMFALPVGKYDIFGKVPATFLASARRAVMCEILRVDAGFESGWRWNEGTDTKAGPEKPDEEETGAWQVSANSMLFDKSLTSCCIRNGATSLAPGFIATIKSNHAFAVEYAARLFRFNTRWSGPANRGWILAAVSKEAVAEFAQTLA